MDKKFPMIKTRNKSFFSVESSFFSIPANDSNHFVLKFNDGVLDDTFFIHDIEVMVVSNGNAESLDVKISESSPTSLDPLNPSPYPLEDLIFIQNNVEIINGISVLPINRFYKNTSHLRDGLFRPKKELYVTITNNTDFRDIKIRVNCNL